MYTGFIASRYAAALYCFAEEGGEETLVYAQVKALTKVFSKDKHLLTAFQSPITPLQIKMEAVGEMLSQPLSTSLDRFVRLVINHNREKFFLFMLFSYIKVYKEKKGIMDVTIITAAPIDDENRDKLVSLVSDQTLGKEVEVITKVNPALIGGFIIRVNNKLVNASIGRQISLLKQRYEQQ